MTSFADVVAEITSGHEVNDQEQVVSVFEGVVHVYQEASSTFTYSQHPSYIRDKKFVHHILISHVM